MNYKQTLFKAIVSGNWESVRELYKEMFDEMPPAATSISELDEETIRTSERKNVLDKINNLFNNYYDSDTFESDDESTGVVLDKVNSNVVDASEDVELESEALSRIKTGWNKKGEKLQPNKPKFITGEPDKTDDIPIQVKKQTKKKPGRPKYVPDMKTCEKCQQDFDFNKDFPHGNSIGEDKIMRCSKCLGKK